MKTSLRSRFNSWAVIAVLGAALGAAACGGDTPGDTPDYAAQVNENLKSANLQEVRADWRENEQQLHLSGEVQRAADRERAEELARQVVGTTGQIVNEVKVEEAVATNMDNQIQEQLGRTFEDTAAWDKFDGKTVMFNVENGVVTITGTVPSQAVKDRVGEHARQVEGVKDVVNNLEVRQSP